MRECEYDMCMKKPWQHINNSRLIADPNTALRSGYGCPMLVQEAGISDRDKQLHPTEYCGVQLLIPAWNTGFWRQSCHIMCGRSICTDPFKTGLELAHHCARARLLSLARSKLRLCSANHRACYFGNLSLTGNSQACVD